jgi:hypothetical protein
MIFICRDTLKIYLISRIGLDRDLYWWAVDYSDHERISCQYHPEEFLNGLEFVGLV